VTLLLTGVADRGGAAIDPAGLDPANLLAVKAEGRSVARAQGGVPGLHGARFLAQSQPHILLEAASTNFEDAEPGWTYAREALDRGADLVLASKGALVLHYAALTETAQKRRRDLRFAATVGAPLPVLEMADRVLIGVEITGFEGVLNATTNQVLTSMSGGASYEEGVSEAQALGIAETDPTLDVDGWDAAAKAAIVANAILGASLNLRDVRREGIRQVSSQALREARLAGETIKLIARAVRRDGTVVASVAPERRPLADVLGALRGDQMGVVFFTEPLGRVATTVEHTGGIPTALTVLRDVINVARARGWTSAGE
jgi:homoserine dehydrogenase